MANDNDHLEKHRAIARRILAWGIGLGIVAVIAFIGIWGAITRQMELVTLSAGILGTALGSVVVFYFSERERGGEG